MFIQSENNGINIIINHYIIHNIYKEWKLRIEAVNWLSNLA